MKSINRKRPRSQPAVVKDQESSQQAGEICDRWEWVELGVWTKRMLGRLEESESTTKWFRLWDKVWSERNLQSAFNAVWRNQGSAGVDGQSVKAFKSHAEKELKRLAQELQEGSYRPQANRRVWINKPGSSEKRPLGIPSVRDRVVQAALRNVLEPIFENDFAEHSYGFRPGRGSREAVRRVEKRLTQGDHWVVDLDLKSYFDTIPHSGLMKCVKQRIADGKVNGLIEAYLKAGVLETMKPWQATDKGSPQGAVISPLLSNLYLNPLDHEMEQRGWEMVRYADDAIVLCRSQEAAEKVLSYIKEWTRDAGLSLHPEKTRIVNAARESFDFLGWRISLRKGRSRKWPRKKSTKRLRERLKPLSQRTSGRSLRSLIEQANPILRGWYGYFRESVPSGLYNEDAWVRRRLRAMLRKYEKRPGMGRCGSDQRRWPNRWFAEQGLFSLEHGSCTYT